MTTATTRHKHLARFFGEPLMVSKGKLDTLVSVMADRLGVAPVVEISELTRGEREQLAIERVTTTDDGIRVLSLRGTLLRRARGLNALSGLTGYEALSADLAAALEDENVRGIVLDVDSPGGEAQSSFELADQIREARELKPVFAVANANAHSAAYLLASQAERVYVNRTASVGSIGVYTVHVDQSRANESAGLKPTFVFAGARKVDGNAHEPLSAEVRDRLQARVNRTYELFVQTVAKGREGLSEKAIRETEADTFEGQEAIDAGLATHMGGLEAAIKDMREELEVSEKQTAQVAGLQKTIDAQAASIQTLEKTIAQKDELIARLQAQVGDQAAKERKAYLNSIVDRCAEANVLPPKPDQLADVELALEQNDELGKKFGEAVLASCLAGKPADKTTSLDPNATEASKAREDFLAGFSKE